MLVHRLIGLSEIEALLKDGVVNPLAENNRDCLYFFDSDEHGCPSYQLEYLHGIVGEMFLHKTDDRFYFLIHCDIPEKRFKVVCERYADPEGSWFETIGVDELHLHGSYRRKDVKSVTLYTDHYFGFKQHSSYDTIEEAYEFLKSMDVHSLRSFVEDGLCPWHTFIKSKNK